MESALVRWGVHQPFLTHMELDTAKSVERLLDIRIALQMDFLIMRDDRIQLTVPMLMVLVSLMAAIHASISGLLQQPLMKWVRTEA